MRSYCGLTGKPQKQRSLGRPRLGLYERITFKRVSANTIMDLRVP
jgi:hypothetical protein